MTRTAATGSLVDVRAAVTASADGDTVVIPPGTWTWAGTLSIIGKSITLTAASPGTVTILNNLVNSPPNAWMELPIIDVTPSKTSNLVISNLAFDDGPLMANTGGSAGNMMIRLTRPSGKTNPLIVHDCVFTNHAKVSFQVKMYGALGDLFYNTTFRCLAAPAQTGNNDAVAVQGFTGWQAPSTMGSLDTNGATNLYFEDCVFTNWVNDYIVDAESNARVVIRRCQITNCLTGSHGQESDPAGCRHIEIYGNTFVNNEPTLSGLFTLRGGTAVVANNTGYSIPGKTATEFAILALTRNTTLQCSVTSYPIPRQVGQGWNGATPNYASFQAWQAAGGTVVNGVVSGSGSYSYPQATTGSVVNDGSGYITDPVFIWGNDDNNISFYNDGGTQISCPTTGRSQIPDGYLIEGRDYQRNQPKPGWAQLIYPHPLRGNTPPPPLGPVAAIMGKVAITKIPQVLKQPPITITATASLLKPFASGNTRPGCYVTATPFMTKNAVASLRGTAGAIVTPFTTNNATVSVLGHSVGLFGATDIIGALSPRVTIVAGVSTATPVNANTFI